MQEKAHLFSKPGSNQSFVVSAKFGLAYSETINVTHPKLTTGRVDPV